MIKPSTLSNTAHAILSAAAQRDNHRALPPERLPVAAQRAVVRSMLNAGLLELVPAEDDEPGWHTAEGDERQGLRATEIGLAAVGAESVAQAEIAIEAGRKGPNGAAIPDLSAPRPDIHHAPPRSPARLRTAAMAVVSAWDDTVADQSALPHAVEALRAAMATSAPCEQRPARGGTKPPRSDTKHAALLTLLRRPEGASGPQMADAAGWAPHTVRGFLAGLQKRGISVTVLERVRQVGPGKEGAKGSYTVYRVAEAG